MSGLFICCLSLKTLPDLSKWNTNNVIDLSLVFFACPKLEEIPDISNWNTSKVINMELLFAGLTNHEYLNNFLKYDFIFERKKDLEHFLNNWINFPH